MPQAHHAQARMQQRCHPAPRRYNACMAKIDASRISSDALAELRAGRSVRLVKSGRTIATLRAQRARTQADAARELAVLRDADRGDDWSDYAAWPQR